MTLPICSESRAFARTRSEGVLGSQEWKRLPECRDRTREIRVVGFLRREQAEAAHRVSLSLAKATRCSECLALLAQDPMRSPSATGPRHSVD
jgi:hypothetical protein